MGSLYEDWVRPWLFEAEAEAAHEKAMHWLRRLDKFPGARKALEKLYGRPKKGEPLTVAGVKFPNGVGLAAGFDKNGEVWRMGNALGFGHVEIGTVTPRPQPGNPTPRLFRYAEHEALVNRMGFNNAGAEAVAANLRNSRADRPGKPVVLGISLGANKDTPLEKAAEDYRSAFVTLADFADYVAVNVSSPNTPGLRDLQAPTHLREILKAIAGENVKREKHVPVFVKIAPDLGFSQLDAVVEVVEAEQAAGLIATNTLLGRPRGTEDWEDGGLSGAPLHRRTLDLVNFLSRLTDGKLPIIGCGGVCDVQTAGALWDAGASLVQFYTGLVYKGPFLAREIAPVFAMEQKNWI